MAQGTQAAHTGPREAGSPDHEAWLQAAASRKYRIEGGQVWSGVNGSLFPVPALPGFAGLPDVVKPLVFHAVSQFVQYRVGQTAEGDIVEAVNKAVVRGDIPSPKSNDAFELLYNSTIADKVREKAKAMGKDATPKMIADTIEKYHDTAGELGFAHIVAAAQSNTTRAVKERKRAKAGPKEAMEL